MYGMWILSCKSYVVVIIISIIGGGGLYKSWWLWNTSTILGRFWASSRDPPHFKK